MGRRVAVVGLGIMGSMVLLALARRGVDCVGFEKSEPGHVHGASGGGDTRIFRSLHPDGGAHSTLLRRSRELWLELAAESRRPVFEQCGALSIGPPGDRRIADLLAVARRGGEAAEVLTGPEAQERWPGHRLGCRDRAVLDPRGGLLRAGESVRATIEAARARGADVRCRDEAVSVSPDAGKIEVTTTTGHEAFDGLVLAAGRWLGGLGASCAGSIVPRRVVLSWFPVDDVRVFEPDVFPPGSRNDETTGLTYSFFPVIDALGIKINMQVAQPTVTDLEQCHPAVEAGYAEPWATRLRLLLTGLHACPVKIETYVEGYTADRTGLVHVIDRDSRILAVGGFSGQGFKYAPVMGELAADLVLDGHSAIDHRPFAFPRNFPNQRGEMT